MRELKHNEPGEVFGPKREEVKADRRKLHNEELNEMYYSGGIMKVTK